MRKPFDLEKAKAGEKVLYEGQEAHYIGQCQTGVVVIESVERDRDGEATWMYFVDASLLTMAPVKVTRYINLYPDFDRDVVYGGGEYTSYPTKEEAEASANYESALAVGVPIEVEE